MERDANLSLQRSSPPTWILDLPQFISWKNERGQAVNVLWLSASPGYGKSVLAAYLTEELASLPVDDNALVSYFFCQDTEDLSGAHNILRALAFQLTQYSDEIRLLLRRTWKEQHDVVSLTAPIETLFHRLVQEPLLKLPDHSIYFVLDALNECPPSSMRHISKLIQLFQRVPCLKVLITSQYVPELQSASRASHVELLSLDETHNWSAVQSYIINTVNKDANLKKRFINAKIDPLEFFYDRGRGMFLWVTMLLDDLAKVVSDEDFICILRNDQGNINALYHRIFMRLEKLSNTQKSWVRQMFIWLLLARRSLNLEELKAGVCISQKLVIGECNTFQSVDADVILKMCDALVRIRESEYPNSSKSISLVHDSLKQYMTSDVINNRIFYIVVPIANDHLASACILCLLSEDKPRDREERDYKVSSIFAYSTLFFAMHLQEAQISPLTSGRLSVLLWTDKLADWLKSALVACRNVGNNITEGGIAESIWTLVQFLHDMREKTSLNLRPGLVLPPLPTDILGWVVGLLTRLWLTAIPDTDTSIPQAEAFLVIEYLYRRSVEDSMDEEFPNDVYAIANWAGYDGFERDALWHYNVGSALHNHWPMTKYSPFHWDQWRQAVEQCSDREIKIRILNMFAESLWEDRGSDDESWAHLPIDYYIACYEGMLDDDDRPRGDLLPDLLFERFEALGSIHDLNKAISMTQSLNFEDTDSRLSLAVFLQKRWDVAGSEDDLIKSAFILQKEDAMHRLQCLWDPPGELMRRFMSALNKYGDIYSKLVAELSVYKNYYENS